MQEAQCPQFPMTTTLNQIRAHSPCCASWNTLLRYLNKTKADDEPLLFSTILESNRLNDVVWCFRLNPEYHKVCVMFAVWAAKQVKHLLRDERSIRALSVAENHLYNPLSMTVLKTAAAAAASAAADAAAAAAAATDATAAYAVAAAAYAAAAAAAAAAAVSITDADAEVATAEVAATATAAADAAAPLTFSKQAKKALLALFEGKDILTEDLTTC